MEKAKLPPKICKSPLLALISPSFLKIQKILPEWKNLKMTTLLPLKSAPFNVRKGVFEN